MPQIPVHPKFDASIQLLKEPYHFISRHCSLYGSPLFQTRIMLQKTICMTGAKAASFFYDEQNFIRKGGMPEPILATLLGKGGVQGLDGTAHRHRKKMFMSVMTSENIERLVKLTEKIWMENLPGWMQKEKIHLYDEFLQILTRAVCSWVGIPLDSREVKNKTELLRAMFDDAGSAGLRHFHSRRSRKQAESWITEIVNKVRNGELEANLGSPLETVCFHHDENGQLLKPKIAAIEILNLLRPTVAVAVYIDFCAHALHFHPESRMLLQGQDEHYPELFVQEVRRFYPFFPAVAAKARRDLEWQGYKIPAGVRVLLDLYGTNHDPELWYQHNQFIPERFKTWNNSPYSFIPQGGGNPYQHHRCPGEKIAIELMKMATKFLSRKITYSLPEQNLSLLENKLPGLPASKMIIQRIQRVDSADRQLTL